MGIRVLHYGTEPHYCSLPGWWQRRKLGLTNGAVVECEACGVLWELSSDQEGGRYWSRLHKELPSANVSPTGEAPPRSE